MSPSQLFLTSPLFSVDSTPAASRRSASGLASFSGAPRLRHLMAWPFGLAQMFVTWARRLQRLVALTLASPLFLSGLDACCVSSLSLRPRFFCGCSRCLRYLMAWPFGLAQMFFTWTRCSAFGLASFFEWTRRLRRLVARPSASLLFRMTPVPAPFHGLAFWTR